MTSEHAEHLSSDLELPDWSGMEENKRQLTPDEAIRLSEKKLALTSPEVKRRHQQLYSPCPVEFVL